MSVVKKIAMGVAGVAVILGGSFIYNANSAVSTTEEFFKALKNKQQTAGEVFLADSLKTKIGAEALKSLFGNGSDNTFEAGALWQQRVGLGFKDATVKGSVKDPKGKYSAIAFTMVREGGAWKIADIGRDLSKADVENRINSQSLPSKEEQLSLISVVTHNMVLAKTNKDMKVIYDSLAPSVQKQVTLDALNKANAAMLVDTKNDLTVLDQVQPIINKAVIEKPGVLMLGGYYPLTPPRVFQHQFVYEDESWKLATSSLQTASSKPAAVADAKKASDTAAPSKPSAADAPTSTDKK